MSASCKKDSYQGFYDKNNNSQYGVESNRDGHTEEAKALEYSYASREDFRNKKDIEVFPSFYREKEDSNTFYKSTSGKKRTKTADVNNDNFKNPFEKEDKTNKNDDPFAPNPSLSLNKSGMDSKANQPNTYFIGAPTLTFKDPFSTSTTKDPFNSSSLKNPFENEKQKNPFEVEGEERERDDMPFKASGLSLGLTSLGTKPQAHPNMNVFKTGAPSPMGGYFMSGMDSGTEAARIAYFNQVSRHPYPMMSPSGAASTKRAGKHFKREMDQSPSVEMMNHIFQTPTSRGFMQRFGDMSAKKDETGSFGASPKDISTTKAVFNQQTKFGHIKKEYEVPTPQRGMNRDSSTPSQPYFTTYPYGFVNYQNAYMSNYGNTPTGGSFGASPAGWNLNMPSPHTGLANNYISPFNQSIAFEAKEVAQEPSPKFNTISESHRQPPGFNSGQDSVRQYNAQFTSAFNKTNTAAQNYAVSPVNAFSFS